MKAHEILTMILHNEALIAIGIRQWTSVRDILPGTPATTIAELDARVSIYQDRPGMGGWRAVPMGEAPAERDPVG